MGFVQSRFTAWSFSRWNDYTTCPAFAKYKHLDKLKEEQHPAAARGQDIGNRVEAWLKKQTRKMPVELQPMAADYKELRTHQNLFVEQMWGFTKSWVPCPWDDWAKCWLRVKIDVGYAAHQDITIVDNKTGKYREAEAANYMLQTGLYCVAGLSKWPTMNRATARLYYSDLNIKFPIEGPATMKVESLHKEQTAWTKRVAPMFADTRFAPRPGPKCRYCSFSKAKDGPCKF